MDIPLITDNPFVKDEEGEYAFRFTIPNSNATIECNINIRCAIESLLADNYQGEMMVCGCGDAGCAGFRNERCRRTGNEICWSFAYYNCHVELHFERQAYEQNIIEMLDEMITSRKGWNPFEYIEVYKSFDEFHSAVLKLKETLASKRGDRSKDQDER